MASRQESFFNQSHTGQKKIPQWRPDTLHPSCKYPQQQAPSLPKPAIRASFQSRTKLQAFTYNKLQSEDMIDVRSDSNESDKENRGTLRKTQKSQSSQKSPPGPDRPAQSRPSQLSKTPKSVTRRTPPETPGISLEDLLDDNHDREVTPPQSTPKDQVGWEHARLRSSQLTPITPSMHRGSKRPRSESPSSSKASDDSNKKAHAKRPQTLNTKTPMRTPRYDPGPDLWNRYARNQLNTPTRPPATAAPTMEHSSPQEPFTSGSRSWRRTTSDLTHTTRKRRKLDTSLPRSGSQENAIGTPTAVSAARARIPFLLEKLKEVTEAGIQKQTSESQGMAPSSSTPLLRSNIVEDELPVTSQQLAELAMSDNVMDERLLPEGDAEAKAKGSAELNNMFDEMPSDPFEPVQGEGKDTTSDALSLMMTPQPNGGAGHGAKHTKQGLVQPQVERAGNSQSFSDFDMGEDELLSTCLQVEQASEPPLQTSIAPVSAPSPGPILSVHDNQNHTVERDQERLKRIRVNQNTGQVLFDEEARHELTVVEAGIDFAPDEFNEEDLADMDLAMSRYDQTQQPRAAGAENTVQHDDRIRHDNPMTNDEVALEKGGTGAYGEQSNPVDLLDDEFGGDGIEDAFAELVNEQGQRGVLASHEIEQPNKRCKTIQRYLVKQVQDGHYQTDKGYKRQERVVIVEEERTGMFKAVLLRDAWFDSPCTPGAYVHVLGIFNHVGQCIIDNDHGILVLHPDHLISATIVADSFGCMRRAVLQDRVKATNAASEPQVYGHILHEIFQGALKENRWDTQWLSDLVEKVAERYLESLFEINVGLGKAKTHLMSKLPELQSWAQLFVLAEPKPESLVKDRNAGKALMSINKLLDVEEHIWSPMYGLKGNVDASVQVLTQDANGMRTLTVPLELKTGKNSSNASHKAQTALYTLLMSDRYDIQVAYGILYYLETSEMIRIPGLRHELMHMIKQRNELACYVRNRQELPPMLKNERLCGRCYAQISCFTYHKLIEDGDGETSGLKDKFKEKMQHLLPQHKGFFQKWDALLTKEEGDMMKFRRELWTMTSTERQKVGRCFARLIIEPGTTGEVLGAQKINRYKYTFVKQEAGPFFSFAESQITVGEPIVISDEQGHYALANGYVTSLRKDRVTVAVDRRLHNARTRRHDFHKEENQNFAGIMEVKADGNKMDAATEISAEPIVYRLDKDEFSNGMATVRNNLIRLMEKDLFGAQPLRRLIIDKVAPSFSPDPSKTAASATQSGLNVDQRAAIEKVMTAKDYALVLGMPGTGKTTTIAHIIRALTSQGRSVLLTSYTHTAVDNILLKIRDDNISILRIGAVAKVHPLVAEFADLAAIPKTTAEDLKKSYASQVVATTCLGINHPIFNQRIFDYCIVDEASQITLPVCLGPIRMARTFILVGDHFQLPPLVQNKEALEGGLDVSLFKYLSDAHPNSVVTLQHQYRMCADIMALSNELIYDGRLKCGNDAVASRCIEIPDFSALDVHHHTANTLSRPQISFCPRPQPNQCWLHDALRPSSPVIFLNTDPLGDLAMEQANGRRIVNQMEVTLTTQLVTAMLTVGIKASEIGVITLYRSQLAQIRQELKARSTAASAGVQSLGAGTDVEMHTADKYQGRDKEAIVLSLVRNNDTDNVGDLLKDWRRVNVALTRARTKMVIIGSWKTMEKGNELLNRFCHMVADRGWRYDLKKGAAEDHYFEDFPTQCTITKTSHDTAAESGKAKPIGAVKQAQSSVSKVVKGVISEPTSVRKVLGTQSGNNRKPERRCKISPEQVLNKRPVLVDIINDSQMDAPMFMEDVAGEIANV